MQPYKCPVYVSLSVLFFTHIRIFFGGFSAMSQISNFLPTFSYYETVLVPRCVPPYTCRMSYVASVAETDEVLWNHGVQVC